MFRIKETYPIKASFTEKPRRTVAVEALLRGLPVGSEGFEDAPTYATVGTRVRGTDRCFTGLAEPVASAFAEGLPSWRPMANAVVETTFSPDAVVCRVYGSCRLAQFS